MIIGMEIATAAVSLEILLSNEPRRTKITMVNNPPFRGSCVKSLEITSPAPESDINLPRAIPPPNKKYRPHISLGHAYFHVEIGLLLKPEEITKVDKPQIRKANAGAKEGIRDLYIGLKNARLVATRNKIKQIISALDIRGNDLYS